MGCGEGRQHRTPSQQRTKENWFPLTMIPLPRMSEAKRIDRGDVEEVMSVGGEGERR